ncbi:MAG: hypothetical protein Q8K63_15635 [Acidimicrobiales bacterium]|nr:hypothetical protein [Acidimicrobiales bacterium]
MKLVLACALAALSFVGGACRGGPHIKPEWSAGEFAVPSENVLWTVCGQEMQRVGFPVGTQASAARMLLSSGWRTELAPFRGKGYRVRAEVRFERVAPARYKVDVRVAKEVNNDMIRPLDPAQAKWEAVADDVETAQILLQRIRSRLSDPLEVNAPKSRSPGAPKQ